MRTVIQLLLPCFFVGLSMTFAAEFPLEPKDQVQGFYTHGKIEGASVLPEQGVGFVGLFRQRARYFGSQGLVEILQSVAAELAALFPFGERLQIGDLSGEQGGFISGHASHQNGLDADIAYFRTDYQEQPKGVEGFPMYFVKKGKITPEFDLERNFVLLDAFMKTGRANRLFVDPVIKQAMCQHAKTTNRWETSASLLRHIRPLAAYHANHVHVRLTCPKESLKCEKQDSIPAGTGCDLHSLFQRAELAEFIDN